ncbi:DUF1707 domain-containing protein [Nonomuraea sp. NPDC050783]|uniref:DUF1707 SHOCT-like domain-containing protein n=1 Tax=Nonomuraea sp. NPDC050783 TaxID=3154634 RepID=UPI0034666B1B
MDQHRDVRASVPGPQYRGGRDSDPAPQHHAGRGSDPAPHHHAGRGSDPVPQPGAGWGSGPASQHHAGRDLGPASQHHAAWDADAGPRHRAGRHAGPDAGQQAVRASDADREAAAERLRVAVEEGCLDFGEFNDRMGLAYQSVTRGELAALVADLPAEPRPAVAPATRGRAARRRLPRWVKVLWAGWGTVFTGNVAVWAAMNAADPCPVEFWPSGLLPPGFILAMVTVGTILRNRDARAEGS